MCHGSGSVMDQDLVRNQDQGSGSVRDRDIVYNVHNPVIVIRTNYSVLYHDFHIAVLYSLQVTHNASPVTPIQICVTVLNESDDLDILGVTFDSKMTFHIRKASLLGFQSSFSKTWYLEEVLVSIP